MREPTTTVECHNEYDYIIVSWILSNDCKNDIRSTLYI